MVTSAVGASMNPLARIGLWFGSLLVSVLLISVFLSLLLARGDLLRAESLFFVCAVTTMFALPVGLLYLPFVIALKNAEGQRIWIILVSGILIGPLSVGLWVLFVLQGGGDPEKIWYGDPLLCGLGGIPVGMLFALIVGSLTTSFYGFALRRRFRTPAQGRVWRGAI